MSLPSKKPASSRRASVADLVAGQRVGGRRFRHAARSSARRSPAVDLMQPEDGEGIAVRARDDRLDVAVARPARLSLVARSPRGFFIVSTAVSSGFVAAALVASLRRNHIRPARSRFPWHIGGSCGRTRTSPCAPRCGSPWRTSPGCCARPRRPRAGPRHRRRSRAATMNQSCS